MRFALVAPEQVLLEEIEDRRLHQRDIAATYALAINTYDEVDWRRVNTAIIDRWSMSGLQRVKAMAWRLRRAP